MEEPANLRLDPHHSPAFEQPTYRRLKALIHHITADEMSESTSDKQDGSFKVAELGVAGLPPGSPLTIDPTAEKRLVRKTDLILMPILCKSLIPESSRKFYLTGHYLAPSSRLLYPYTRPCKPRKCKDSRYREGLGPRGQPVQPTPSGLLPYLLPYEYPMDHCRQALQSSHHHACSYHGMGNLHYGKCIC